MSIMKAVADVGDPAPQALVYVAGTFSADPPVGGATEAKQDDGITLLTTIDADTSALAGAVSGTEMQVDVLTLPALAAGTNNIGDVDIATIAAGETHVGEVGGSMALVAASFTRPADTTAYTAKDAVSNSTSAPTVLTFTNLARVNAGSGYIVKARLITNQSTCIARFRLHLFHTAPTAINDNAAYTLLYTNAAIRLGYIDFPACQTEGSGSDAANAQNDTVRLAFVCAAASRTIYGVLETIDAFTPASAQQFYIELTADDN